MQYIPVFSLNDINDLNKLIIDQCGHCLVSIISGLHQKEFGLDTLNKIKIKIKKFKSDIGNNKLFIDSGGYSIIIGDVNPKDFKKFIECYHNYLITEYETYDYIFSLDIPISLKYQSINTTNNIYELNKLSLNQSKLSLLNNNIIRDKFYFVWHFKILNQYRIWDKLYHELELNKIVSHNQSIGGLVGLRDYVNINFTPFIGMGFRTLYNYILSNDFIKPLRIHILGVYSRTDRFAICLLEKLFNKILEKYNTSCSFTYDSVNYLLSAYLKARSMDVFNIENDNIIKYNTGDSIPNELIELVYHNNFDYISEELNRIQNNDKLDKIHSFAPLNVYSNLQIDKFISNQIDKYKLTDTLIGENNYFKFKNYLVSVLHDLNLKYKDIFTNNFLKTIEENCKYIYAFYSLIRNNNFNDYDKLDNLIVKNIQNIKYPFNLIS